MPSNPDREKPPTEHAAQMARAIRAALRCGRFRCECARQRGNVHCPAHDDSDPSLSVNTDRHRVVWYCHTGCGQYAVLDQLRARGLWP